MDNPDMEKIYHILDLLENVHSLPIFSSVVATVIKGWCMAHNYDILKFVEELYDAIADVESNEII